MMSSRGAARVAAQRIVNAAGGRRRPAAGAVGFVVLALGSGCAARESVLEITSLRDPYFPERFRVAFDQCAYRIDRGGDYQILARAARAADDAGGGPIVQLLHVHVFWKPWPGKTPDHASGVDATLCYVVASDEGASVFTGTGFVYPRRDWQKSLIAEIEGGRLQLAARIGNPPQVLGDARVVGRLQPVDDVGQTVALQRELERRAAR